MCVKWFYMRRLCMRWDGSLPVRAPCFSSASRIFHRKSNILYACNGNKRCFRIRNDNLCLLHKHLSLCRRLTLPSCRTSSALNFVYKFFVWLSWVWKSSCKLQIIHRFNGNTFTKDMPIPHTLDCVSAGEAIYTNAWSFSLFVCLCIHTCLCVCALILIMNLNKT